MAESGPTGREISVTEAQQRQQTGAVLVDVREPDEWVTGHAPGARNVPLSQIAEHLDQLRQVPDLLLVCRSGNRSGQAQRFLAEQGVAATNVAGGLRAWAEAGLPLEP